MLLRYSFDEASSGDANAADLGSSPAANGVFFGNAGRTNSTPAGFSVGTLNLNAINGTSHYVSAGDADKLDSLSNLTLTAWVNLQGPPVVSDRLLSKLFSDGTRGSGFDLRITSPPSGSLLANNFGLGFALINTQLISSLPTVISTVGFNASNTWLFMAVTYDGTNVRFWRGGVTSIVAQAGATLIKSPLFGRPMDTSADFRVGSTAATSVDRTPPAWLDDVRVYDAALTLAELESVRVENVSAAPVINQQPADVTAGEGNDVILSVSASGAPPLSYQWYFEATPVLNGTNAALVRTNISLSQAGNYFVVVSNSTAATTSRVATVTVVPPLPPALVAAIGGGNRRSVVLGFDHPLSDSSTNATNFVLGGGLALLKASLEPGLSNLTLVTSVQAPNATYSLTIRGIRTRGTGNALMPETGTNFASPPLYGPLNNVPEAANWNLLYTLNVPHTANFNSAGAPYLIDHRRWVTNFSRVAYYLELQKTPSASLEFVWVAMDAFSFDPGRVGVPASSGGAVFQQAVTNLDVRSSVPGIIQGAGLNGGSILFAPGSEGSLAAAGRGLMMISNSVNGQLLFALNGWGNGGVPEVGIGSVSSSNATSYSIKRLMVFVLPRTNAPTEADIMVYGGTSGGVAAAVQAARMGKRAVLLCLDNHVGGLSSGGLGWTDLGANGTGYIGGIANEFYRRNGARYGQNVRYNLEPRVAEQIFGEMLAEAGVRVVFNQRLASVVMTNQRLAQITMGDGSVYRGKMFIDTTYEGDLMAAAGVTFVTGREGTNAYNESFAGVTSSGNGGYDFDPYLIPGNPSSGLLPFVKSNAPPPRGSADIGVQAYNYRMIFTQSATNLLPMTAPADYDETKFELLGRYLESRVATDGTVTLPQLMTLDRPPVSGKYDINANGTLSTDLVGESWTWGTNTSAGRAEIAKVHENYMRGFFTYLATSPRAPANIGAAMQSWGMCQDEFLDTGGWPHAVYVREARRMVSDYVMLQQNCQGARIGQDGIGLGAYQMDSHAVRRYPGGNLTLSEGNMFVATPAPFPISYRSIIPRVGECENLFCTFALSASHVAFGSCRMEPVFMITSQSAATAAAFAIDDNVPVQQVNYPKLALQLRVDGQVLGSGGTTGDSGIILDNVDTLGVSVAGGWTASTGAPGYWGSDFLHDGNTAKGTKSVTFRPNLPTNEVYDVYVRWAAASNRDINVPIDIVHPAGTNTFFVNQQTGGGVWNKLLTTNFAAGTSGRVAVRNDGTTGYVVADAVRFVARNAPAATVEVVATDGAAREFDAKPAQLTFVRNGDTNSALTVSYLVDGTASIGVDYVGLPGSLVIPPGVLKTNLFVTPVQDSIAEGKESVVLTLQSGTNYAAGPVGAATISIEDYAPAQFLSPVYENGTVRLRFFGTPGAHYVIQRASSVSGPWSTVADVDVPYHGNSEWVDAAPLAGQAFYRATSQ